MAKPRSTASRDLSRRVQAAFGALLKTARNGPSERIPQQIVADALEVTRTSVSNIENGRHRVFLDQVYAAARALNVPISNLLPDEQTIHASPGVHVASNSEIDARHLQALGPFAASARARAQKRAVRQST